MSAYTVKYINLKGKAKSLTIDYAATTDDAIDLAISQLGQTYQYFTSVKPKLEKKVRLPKSNRSIEEMLG